MIFFRKNCIFSKKVFIDHLPLVNYSTLSYLIKHLKLISDNSEKNKMTVKNLAMMFGPTLFLSKHSHNHSQIVADINNQWRILSSLIEEVDYFFGQKALSNKLSSSLPSFDRKLSLCSKISKSSEDVTIEPEKNPVSKASIGKLMENAEKIDVEERRGKYISSFSCFFGC